VENGRHGKRRELCMCERECKECIHVTHYGCAICRECPRFTGDKALLKAAKIHGIKAYYNTGINGAFSKMERDGLGLNYLKGQMQELCEIVVELAMKEGS